MEGFQGSRFFSNTDELDRFAGDRTDRQGRATACITIRLCEYDTVSGSTSLNIRAVLAAS